MKLLRLAAVVAGAMLAFDVGAEERTNQTLSVVVQDSSGNPVAGATVECYYLRFLDITPDAAKSKAETTDTNGVALIPFDGNVGQIAARKPGLAIACSYCGRPSISEPIVLTMAQPQSISGIVVDEADKPVADAKVSVGTIYCPLENNRGGSYMNGECNEELLFVRTGTDGRFRIEGIPTNGAADLIVKKKGQAMVPLSRQAIGPDLMTARAGKNDVKLQMRPGASIEGKVEIPEGSRKTRVLIRAVCEEPSQAVEGRRSYVRATADGSFRIEDLGAGKYRVIAEIETNGVPDWVARRPLVSVEAGQAMRDLKITAIKGGVLEVATVSSKDRKPVKNVYVSIEGTSENGWSCGNSEETGVTFVRLCPGRYEVSGISGNSPDSRPQPISVEIEEGKTNRVEMEMPPPQVAGIVRDTNGVPVPGIEVKIASEFGVKTDTNGYYEIRSGFQGAGQRVRPFVIVRDRERNLAAAKELAEGTNRYDLQLAPALVVSGRVLDEQGKPVTRALVNIVAWGGNAGWWIDNGKTPKIDAQGRFEIGALPVGRTYSVNVSAKGYGSAYSKNEDIDTNRFEFDPITLRIADKKIAGVVVDADNNPVKGAHVSIFGDGQPNVEVNTDDRGRFAINEVCDGIVNVGAAVDQGTYGTVRVEAGDTNVVVKLGQQAGEVVSQPSRALLVGKPLPDLTAAGIPSEALHTNKPLLICLFDPEQRPSRRVIRLLADQNESLKQKGLTVVGVSAALTTADALKEWKQSNPTPFETGGVTKKSNKTEWILKTEKFPWLILTDAQGRVKAEGFELDELDGKLK